MVMRGDAFRRQDTGVADANGQNNPLDEHGGAMTIASHHGSLAVGIASGWFALSCLLMWAGSVLGWWHYP